MYFPSFENYGPERDPFELEEAAKPYETMEEWFSHIEEYTEALKKREMGRNTPEKGIRLMTIHAAKGLEFDTVFVIQANEGRIPYKKGRESRRDRGRTTAFYVAMTRAKNRLVFSYVKIKGGKKSFLPALWTNCWKNKLNPCRPGRYHRSPERLPMH